MDKIIWGKSSDEEMTWREAQEWCKAQGGRLPKVWELMKAWEEKEEGFMEDYYWSSKEFSLREAYYVYFISGGTAYFLKARGNSVRCVLNK